MHIISSLIINYFSQHEPPFFSNCSFICNHGSITDWNSLGSFISRNSSVICWDSCSLTVGHIAWFWRACWCGGDSIGRNCRINSGDSRWGRSRFIISGWLYWANPYWLNWNDSCWIWLHCERSYRSWQDCASWDWRRLYCCSWNQLRLEKFSWRGWWIRSQISRIRNRSWCNWTRSHCLRSYCLGDYRCRSHCLHFDCRRCCW